MEFLLAQKYEHQYENEKFKSIAEWIKQTG